MGLLSNIKAALFPAEVDPDSPPAWIGRLKESKFVSLSGVEIPFLYLDLSSFFPVKTSSFGSVDGDGAYIQHNGLGGFRFPVAMIFTGSENDIQAQAAIQALTERGKGTLFHPVHGRIDVIAGGEIQQENAFVTAANQTIITVEFFETTGLQIDNLPPFDSVLDGYNVNAQDAFAESVNVDDVADEVSFRDKVGRVLGKVKGTMDRLSNGVAATQAAIDDQFDSINNALDILVKDPLMLARQMQNLILTPGREIGLLKSKIEAYGNLARDIFTDRAKPNGYDFEAQNNQELNLMVAGACIGAASQVGFNADFETKQDYIDAAIELNALAEDFDSFLTQGNDAIGNQAVGNGWQDLLDTTANASAQLVANSFAALTQMSLITTSERLAADWCFELYASAKNDKRWFFANTNNLGPDEILTIKSGRELVYYV